MIVQFYKFKEWQWKNCILQQVPEIGRGETLFFWSAFEKVLNTQSETTFLSSVINDRFIQNEELWNERNQVSAVWFQFSICCK